MMAEGKPEEQQMFLSLPHEARRGNSIRHGAFRFLHAKPKELEAIRV
jgi:hypothetical protein